MEVLLTRHNHGYMLLLTSSVLALVVGMAVGKSNAPTVFKTGTLKAIF